jgi:hypothetical protein
MALFNESMTSVYLYVSITLSGVTTNIHYDDCGTALMAVVILTFSVNLLYFLYSFIRKTALICKARWDQRHKVKLDV